MATLGPVSRRFNIEPLRYSSAVNMRPNAGVAPMMSKNRSVTTSPEIISGSPASVTKMAGVALVLSARASSVFVRACQSRKSADDVSWSSAGAFDSTCTRRTTQSPLGRGKARNRTPETTLKTAVFNPTPIASVSTTVAANAGLRRSKRRA